MTESSNSCLNIHEENKPYSNISPSNVLLCNSLSETVFQNLNQDLLLQKLDQKKVDEDICFKTVQKSFTSLNSDNIPSIESEIVYFQHGTQIEQDIAVSKMDCFQDKGIESCMSMLSTLETEKKLPKEHLKITKNFTQDYVEDYMNNNESDSHDDEPNLEEQVNELCSSYWYETPQHTNNNTAVPLHEHELIPNLEEKEYMTGKSCHQTFAEVPSSISNFKMPNNSLLNKYCRNTLSLFSYLNEKKRCYLLLSSCETAPSDFSLLNINEPLKNLDLTDKQQVTLLTYCLDNDIWQTMRKSLRKFNQDASQKRPEESFFANLDSSLKKNTAFVRKIKTFTESQVLQLINELSNLNLTKYVSEIASALTDAKLKMSDIWPAIQFCSIMHQIYTDFSVCLLENCQRVLSLKKDEKPINQAKLRVDLRLYAELISTGVFSLKESLPLLGNILTVLTVFDKEEHNNINLILNFCRHCGEEYAGLIPRNIKELACKHEISLSTSSLLPKEKQKSVKALLKDYYNSLCKHLLRVHQDLKLLIRQNKKILHTKGELSIERKEKLNSLQSTFDQIEIGTRRFAEVLDEDFPVLPDDDENKSNEMLNSSNNSIFWDDDDTRGFYEILPNLKEFIPNLSIHVREPEMLLTEEAIEVEFEKELTSENKSDFVEELQQELDETEEVDHSINISHKILFEKFLNALCNCTSQEMVDNLAVDFILNFNTKNNRRKLTRALFNVPRTRLDLLPLYARLAASLHPVIPDIAADLSQMLKHSFKYHVHKKDQLNIESKIKIVCFIGELIKFKMFSKVDGLYCLKTLVQDFDHHHIEMCCNFLESCGRFLFKQSDCYPRMKVYLDQIKRKKTVLPLNSRYITLIENAYCSVNPPNGTKTYEECIPPEQKYISKLLYQDLNKNSTEKVLRQIRKLDWDDPNISAYAIKCLTYAFEVKYFNIRCLASLLAGLAVHQRSVATQVVDGVLEDIRLGLEANLPKFNQRRVAMVKYLGELYNYKIVESSNIFQVLYSIITFGITWDHTISSSLDPPENLFRIRMVCVLLETCGQYFSSGLSKKRLDEYLVCFQYYYWFKFTDPHWTPELPFPDTITHLFKETLLQLRKDLHLFESFLEVQNAVDDLVEIYESSFNIILQGDELVVDDQDNTKSLSDKENLEYGGGISGKTNTNLETEDFLMFYSDQQISEDTDEENSLHMSDNSDLEWNNDICQQDYYYPVEIILSKKIVNRPVSVPCPEDEEFLNAFEQMVTENIQSRICEPVIKSKADLSIPVLRTGTKKTYAQLREEKDSMKSCVNFVLMMRKGHKQQFKSLVMPVDSEVVQNLKSREEAERLEKERVKRLTLNISERQEEEDYHESSSQFYKNESINLNRERKVKYQHPKGAPDVTHIFGPKKG